MTPAGPPEKLEALATLLFPPACREEVIGDLHERFRSTPQWLWELARTLPAVVLSRVCRTADPRVVLMHAFALYLSFVGAAWFADRALLSEESGMARLAMPAAAALLGLLLADAYARPGKNPWLQGPVIASGCALLTFALPGSVLVAGAVMALVMMSAIRLLFPPVTAQRFAYWTKLDAPAAMSRRERLFLEAAAALALIAVLIQLSR